MFSYTYIKLFIYILAGFIGFVNIVFLFFLSKYKNSGNKKLYGATRNFSLSALVLVVMYFFFLFIRFVFGELNNNAVLRVFDILAFLGLKYFWLKIMLAIIVELKHGTLHRLVDGVFMIFTVLCVINFGFLMDTQYYIADAPVRYYVTAVSILLSIVPLVINGYIIVRYYHQMVNRIDKIFIIVNSLLIHQNACWNGVMAIRLYSGKIVLSTWDTPITDPTSVFLLLINSAILVFIYQTDFSPLFKLPAALNHNVSPSGEPEIVDLLAFKHSLTVREREVAILVYQGYTNPDIAERLIISKNTVRNHIHNIFYKLDVSSRLELVHLINSQK